MSWGSWHRVWREHAEGERGHVFPTASIAQRPHKPVRATPAASIAQHPTRINPRKSPKKKPPDMYQDRSTALYLVWTQLTV